MNSYLVRIRSRAHFKQNRKWEMENWARKERETEERLASMREELKAYEDFNQ
jgi:hypothetical protein